MLMTAIEATVATIAAKEKIAEEERIKAEQRRLHILEVTADTIEYCETAIADAIEWAIKCGSNSAENIKGMPWFSCENDDGISRLIERAKNTYANGEPSFRASGKEIIPTVIIDYLSAHGYKVVKKEESYRIYGVGSRRGYKLKISWGN